jgi:hypothetical protein
MSTAEVKKAPLPRSGPAPRKAAPVRPKAYRLRDDMPKLGLLKGAIVYQHPTGTPASGIAVSLEPRPDACWFPCYLSDLDEVTP